MRSRWLLSQAWVDAYESHLESLVSRIEAGPVSHLGAQCRRFLANRWYLPRLLFKAFAIAPAGSLDRLKSTRIAVTGAGEAFAADVMPDPDSRNALPHRQRVAEAAHRHLAALGAYESDPALRLSMNIWQGMTSRRNILALPAKLLRFTGDRMAVTPPEAGDLGRIVASTFPVGSDGPCWDVVGPAWFEEMAGAEVDVRTGRDRAGGNTIMGIDASVGDDEALTLLRSVEQKHRGAKTLIWFLDDEPRGRIARELEERHVALACDASALEWIGNHGRCRVHRLEPAIQPRLHNPIGWWNGNAGITGRYENESDIPDRWKARFALARGLQASQNGDANRLVKNRRMDVESIARHRRRFVESRKAWINDPIGRRLEDVERFVVGERTGRSAPTVSVVVPTKRPERVSGIVATLESQTYPDIELILVVNRGRFDDRELAMIVENARIPVVLLRGNDDCSLGELIQYGCDRARGEFIAKMDDDDYYAENYLRDQMCCLGFSEAQVVGMTNGFMLFEDDGSMYLRDWYYEYEYNYVGLRGSTFLFRRQVLDHVGWHSSMTGEDDAFVRDCRRLIIPVVSSGIFNHAFIRRDSSDHTWKADRRSFEHRYTKCGDDVSLRDITC
ncbi:MAG: glycosyltransferase family A protein [Arenicellales bacterium]